MLIVAVAAVKPSAWIDSLQRQYTHIDDQDIKNTEIHHKQHHFTGSFWVLYQNYSHFTM